MKFQETIKRIKERKAGVMITIMFLLLMPFSSSAQDFSVASFRLLPNDVSAFIDNVRDLNDEACALMKVEAPSDFAFSTPLGIVKRKDEVGEIWLYLPKGTKMLTLKHPEWGVIRDYKLDKPLESRMTYELKLNLPKPTITEIHDTLHLHLSYSGTPPRRSIIRNFLCHDETPWFLPPCKQRLTIHREYRR